MYVSVTGSGSARVIQFVEQHRIPKTKKKKTVVIKTIGNYEKMIAEDPQIIEKLKEEAKRLTAEKKARNKPMKVELSRQPILSPSDTTPSFHFGHAAIKALWDSLELDAFFKTMDQKRNQAQLIEAIFSLVMHRMMDPQSIRYSYLDLPHFAGITQHHKDLYYNLLDKLYIYKDQLIDHLCDQFTTKTERTGPVAYYDVTTYRFESVNAGELRLFGYSKDNKHNEVQVVMGLLMDNQGIPISYELFPGNTMDQTTLTQAVEDLKARYKMDKIVVVADRGLNGKDNLAYLVNQDHDFVISYTLKKAPESLKTMALDEMDWENIQTDENGEILYKEKIIAHQLSVKVEL
ncbi:IS1634 family transposase, partial [Amphibacillus indicireducens]|uniref:IS1634 family transposase n=1 Tax=Amphibacillus indicireducens TaxID=1076330 RepID=UPI0031E4EC11